MCKKKKNTNLSSSLLTNLVAKYIYQIFSNICCTGLPAYAVDYDHGYTIEANSLCFQNFLKPMQCMNIE